MKTKIRLLLIVSAAVGLFVALVNAQGPSPPPHHDPLAQFIFPPELVMQHQREIGLTNEQKTFLRGEIQRVTTRFNELQWQLQDAMEGLQGILKDSSVNEQQALAQLERILDTEREIKRLHIELAVRIKNKLTPEQQARLQESKGAHRYAPGRPPNQTP